jgi:copper chaperone NosL
VVRYGQDLCDRCGMVIDDERTAAVARTAGGRELRFDDAGELAAFTREDDEPIAQGWVRDWNGGGWVEHDEAVYVHAPDLATPMGSGIVAFVSREAAERFATGHGGQVLTWSDLERR